MLDYYVHATGIQAVMQAHIHSGTAGEYGTIVVTLFSSNSIHIESCLKWCFIKWQYSYNKLKVQCKEKQ